MDKLNNILTPKLVIIVTLTSLVIRHTIPSLDYPVGFMTMLFGVITLGTWLHKDTRN